MPTDKLGIDRTGLYYWCTHSMSAPLHSSKDCTGLNSMSDDAKAKILNEVIVHSAGNAINFCSVCCKRGDETPILEEAPA